MSQTYATTDSASLGAQLELRDGGLIMTYDTTLTTVARNGRANQSVSTGKHWWECVVYGTEAQVADTAVTGLVLAGTANNVAPGVAANTCGFRPGDGTLWQSGVIVGTVSVAPMRSVIALALDLVARTLRVFVNRLEVHAFVLPAGQVWVPAQTICGAVAYGNSMYINYGARAFEDPVLDGYRPGLFTTSQPFNTVRLGSEDWLSPADDKTAPNVPYAGLIRRAEQFSIERSVTFWPWAKAGGSSFSFAELEVQDNGELEALSTTQPRGARVLLKLVDVDDPSAAPINVGGAVLVRADEAGEDALRIKLQDSLAALDMPIQRKYILPYAADGAAGQLWPISLGATRNVEPTLVDSIRRAYVIHDAPLTQIVRVADRGDKLDPLASPPDWSMTADRRGIELQTEPAGKLTVDSSSSGEAVIVGAPAFDVVEGFGTMTTNVSGMPAEWYVIAANMFHATASRVATGGGRLRLQTSGIVAANPRVTWDVRFRDLRMQRTWLPIKKGCYYRLTYRIPLATWTTVVGFGQFAAGWRVLGAGSSGDAGGSTTVLLPGDYTVEFRAPCDGTLAWYGAGLIDPANNGGSTGPWTCDIDDVVCKLMSADTPDHLAGYGNFIGSFGARWSALTVSAGCSVAYASITSTEYPAPGIGAMQMTIAAGAGKVAQYVYSGVGLALIAGRTYRVALRLNGSTSNARVAVRAQNTVTSALSTVATLSSGTLEAVFQVGAGSWFVLEGFTADALAGTVAVSMVRCVDITDQLAESATNAPLAGISLTDYCRDVIETRAGLSASAWVAADAEAIDAATGRVFGVHTKTAVTGRALLSAPLDSFTAALTTDNEDRIRIVRLVAPEDVPDADIAWEIDQVNATSRPEFALDEAPGLTARVGVRRNWSLQGASDFVDDYDPITGIDAASRTRFGRVSQYVATSTIPLAEMYARARDAELKDSLLDQLEHGQDLVDEANSLYRVPRGFWRVTAYYDTVVPDVWPGRIIRLTWPRPGLTGGLKLLVCRTERVPTEHKFNLIAWGRRS